MATEGLSAAALRVLRGLAGSQGPMTVAELAESLGGHPNTMRLHLQSLLEGGWASELLQAPHGRGRPARAYVPTAAGTRAASSLPAALVDSAFVEALAEHLEALPQPGAAAVSIGRGWGERLGATRDHDGLVGALIGQGFAAERTPDGLAMRSCPLLESARRSPDVACGLHQGLIDALTPEPMTLAPFARPGLCLAVTSHA